jgi:hypothetical protein
MTDNLVSAVLNIPRIEPDNWNIWWSWWAEHYSDVYKAKGNHNTGPGLNKWQGLDIYRTEDYDADKDPYIAKYVDCQHIFPNMFANLKSIPLKISHIRAVQSTQQFTPHRDHNKPATSLRVMLYDNNPTDTFFYLLSNGKLKFQTFPKNSNTWIYYDHLVKHGTHYKVNHFKIILQIWGKWDTIGLEQLLEHSDLNHAVFDKILT